LKLLREMVKAFFLFGMKR